MSIFSLEKKQPTTLFIAYYLQIHCKKLQEQYSPMGSLSMPIFFSSPSCYFHKSYYIKPKRTSYSHRIIGKTFFLLILLSFLTFNIFFIFFSNYFFFEFCVTLY